MILADHMPVDHTIGQDFQMPLSQSGNLWDGFLGQALDEAVSKLDSLINLMWPELLNCVEAFT